MNKFFSLAAGLLITLAGNAQTCTLVNDVTGVTTEYTVGVVNPTQNSNVNFQLIANGNVQINAQYKINQNRFVLPGIGISASFPCTDAGYVNVNETGTFIVSDEAQALIGNVGCSDYDDCTTSNAYLTAQVANLDFALTTVVEQRDAALASLDECDDTVAALLDSINGLEQELYVANFTLNLSTFQLGQAFDDINALEDENAALQAQLDSVEALLTAVITANGAALDAASESILNLTDELVATNNELDSVYTVLDATKLELSDCGDAVDYNFNLIQDLDAEIDGLEATVDGLETALNTCGDDLATAEDEVLYWMDAYGDYVGACDSVTAAMADEIDELETALEGKDCADEYEAGYTQGLLDAPYNYGDVMQAYEFGLSNCECEYNYGDVIEAFYNGYDLGLGDCDGTTGIDILDPSGNVLTQVTGYYNELGQVIDPRTYEGLVIRRHADGTFSKYYVAR